MAALQSDRRRALEKVVKDARDVAEQGARAALESLAVHHHEPHSSMTPAQRDLRARLRAHGRQLGDDRDERKGGQQIDRLVAECAYEHWHRMLFARFLAENDLLIEPESGAAVTLDECAELAKGTDRDAWEVAGSFAQRMLPQVFRTDDPALQVALSPETRIELEGLLASLPREVFLADDSLGWTYQFWQSAEKDRVNSTEEKISGRTLPAVTQLFTEHYMVLFILHNTIGAWWASKHFALWTDAQHVACADELAVRRAVALPDYEFEYLRFVRDEATKRWRPAAGAFESWPRDTRQLRVLDPCCGSGHFLVAALDLLTRLREREEGLPRDRAAVAVLETNLFGLELDPRCTQIAAFALAFAAWKRIGRVQGLPPLRIACSGLAIYGEREAWGQLAGDDALLRGALESLHATFAQASELGSLVDPRQAGIGGFQLTVDFERVLPLLTTALSRESVKRDAEQVELGVAAQGLALAAQLLLGSYTLVATNFPFLGLEKQASTLSDTLKTRFEAGRRELACAFAIRTRPWLGSTGVCAAVMPGEWTFSRPHRHFRSFLLDAATLRCLCLVGRDAFCTGLRASPVLAILQWQPSPSPIPVFDVRTENFEGKSAACSGSALKFIDRPSWAATPDKRLVVDGDFARATSRLKDIADARLGLSAGDGVRFERFFWEVGQIGDDWEFLQGTVSTLEAFGGRSAVVFWQKEKGEIAALAQRVKHLNHAAQNWQRGRPFWGRDGLLISKMGGLTTYTGERFDCRCLVIMPKDQAWLPALLAFGLGGHLSNELTKFDTSFAIGSPKTLLDIPFAPEQWTSKATELGIITPLAPESDDPTQWVFHGHPAMGATPSSHSSQSLGNALQVAAVRLVGFSWPPENDPELRVSPRSRALVEDCRQLRRFADDDGVIPLVAIRGEAPAEQRLRELLRTAFGSTWSAAMEASLLDAAAEMHGNKAPASSLDDWLKQRFFAEHCSRFMNVPFVLHIWDGRKRDGFGVLVHYHRLVAPNGAGRRLLEKLTHGYLGDWIARQRDERNVGKEGADARLVAALSLQERLTKILEGEPPYDLFVRWKPLHAQPIGWEPDINDGVWINLRPFVEADVLRVTPRIKLTKDKGKEPHLPKVDYPWLWGWNEQAKDFQGGPKFTGERFNNLHYTTGFKNAARARKDGRA